MGLRNLSDGFQLSQRDLGRNASSTWLSTSSSPFFSVDTGHNGAGNGGDGYFSGDLIDSPYAAFEPQNIAQSDSHGSATAHQSNIALLDQSATQIAGIGGDGGDDNTAIGGSVSSSGGSGSIATGDDSAGVGGDGVFQGAMVHAPVAVFSPVNIAVAGSSTLVTIADRGNYRIDIRPNGDEITIREGKVSFQGRYVGSCRKISGGNVSECQKKKSDNFDFWSEHQGEGEFFNGRDVVVMVSHLAGIRRVRFRNRGFWFQHPGKFSYTFVPYTSPYFRSPYGGHYSTVLTPRSTPIIRIDRDGGPFGRFPKPEIRQVPRP